MAYHFMDFISIQALKVGGKKFLKRKRITIPAVSSPATAAPMDICTTASS
jgi:hypothetical protein